MLVTSVPYFRFSGNFPFNLGNADTVLPWVRSLPEQQVLDEAENCASSARPFPPPPLSLPFGTGRPRASPETRSGQTHQ